MKTRFYFGIIAVLLLASCEKMVESHVTIDISTDKMAFTAIMDDDPMTRTALSNEPNDKGAYSLYWSSNDEISIYDGTSTAVFTTKDSYSSTAEFVRKTGTISNTAPRYVAFYPSTITMSNMVLPSDQHYAEDNIEHFPMRAVSSNKNLAFKNLCGVIRFSLTSEENDQVAVSSIALSANKGMSGTFTVDDNYAAVVTGTDGVVLKCAQPKSLNSHTSTNFNIVVPQGEYKPLNVKICNSEGKEINLVSEGAINVKRSEITRITLTLAKPSFDTSLENIPITDSDVDFVER